MPRIIAIALLVCLSLPVHAQQTVKVGGKQAILHNPGSARAGAVLVPGRGGITPSDPLLRNRAALNARGIATLTVPHGTVLGQAVKYMRGIKEPVALIGMSAGVRHAAAGVGRGARPDSLVLISGSLMPGSNRPARDFLESPSVLPPTLILHNRNDRCEHTPPSGAEQFVNWSGGRARVQWVGGGGGGDPCGPNSAHGFAGADNEVVNAITQFISK